MCEAFLLYLTRTNTFYVIPNVSEEETDMAFCETALSLINKQSALFIEC